MKIEVIDSEWSKGKYQIKTSSTNISGGTHSHCSTCLSILDLIELRVLIDSKLKEVKDNE